MLALTGWISLRASRLAAPPSSRTRSP